MAAAAAAARRAQGIIRSTSTALARPPLLTPCRGIAVLSSASGGALTTPSRAGLKTREPSSLFLRRCGTESTPKSSSANESPEGALKNSNELVQQISKVVMESPEATTAVRTLLEEFIKTSKLSPAQVDIAKIGVLAEQISKIAKDTPPEAAVVMVIPLVKELTKVALPQTEEVASVKVLEGRIGYLEVSQKNSDKYNFLLNSAIVCAVMIIPAGVFKVQLDVDNLKDNSKVTNANLEKKIESLDSRMCIVEASASALEARVFPAITPSLTPEKGPAQEARVFPAITPSLTPEAAPTEKAPAQEAQVFPPITPSLTPEEAPIEKAPEEAPIEKAPAQEAKIGWLTWIRSKMGFK